MNEKDSLNRLFDRLYPIMRSITGPGLEQSLNIFKEFMPLNVSKTPSGEKVFDWVVPKEWRQEHLRMINEYNNDNIVDLVINGKITRKTPKIIRQF